MFHWKTLAGRCIAHLDDGLSVHQNPLCRWFIFEEQDQLIQSLIFRHFPHKPAMPYLRPFTYASRTSPGPTCLLGLGGGALAHYLLPILKNFSFTAVEQSQAVIHLAQHYFALNRLGPMDLIQNDAETFTTLCKTNYKHLLIDLYTAQGFPKSCDHQDFFMHCQRILTNNGILTLNLPDFNQNIRVFQNLQAVFGKATVCVPVKGLSNMIVFAAHNWTLIQELIYAHPNLKSFIWDKTYGAMAAF